MNIEQVALDIARAFDFDPDALIEYIYEDTVGGWDGGVGRWPLGSIWSVEGRILYAITRALKPEYVIEIGTHHGCSATHFAEAVVKNGGGQVIGVDVNGAAGDLIPAHLRQHVTIHNVLWQDFWRDWTFTGRTLVFEDADHSADTTASVWSIASASIAPGSVIASHDAMHFLVGAAIREGISRSGVAGVRYYPFEVTPQQHMCGLAVWRKPGWQAIAPEPLTVSEKLEVAQEQGERQAEEYRKANGIPAKRKVGRPKKTEKASA